MPRKKIETPVVVPKPKVALKNSGLEIEGQADLDQVLICALDNGRSTTQVLRKELCAPIGTQNLVDLNELKWTEQVVPGRTYTIKVMGADKKGDNSSSEFATVDWSIPAIPAPGNAEPAKDDGSKPVGQADPPKPRELPSAEVGKITEVLTRAHRDLKFFTAKPEELSRTMFDRLDNHVARAGGVINNEYGSDGSLSSLRKTWFECITMLGELSEKLKAREKQRKPEPKPAPPLEPNEDHTLLANRVGSLEKNLDEVKEELGGKASTKELTALRTDLSSQVSDLSKRVDKGAELTALGLSALQESVNGLKPATDPKSGASGNGGNNGGSGASGGGKASAEQPWKLGRSWIGVIITLVIFIFLSLIALCAFQAGWIHKSPAITTMHMGATPPIMVVVTNNAVAPVTPPAVQQALVAATPPAQPAFTPGELADFARQHLATQSEHKQAIEAMFGHIQSGSKTPDKEALKVNGNGNVIGDGNTIINNYHQAPDVHRNGDQTVTPRQTDGATSTNSTAVRANSDWTGPRAVRTLPNWSPTGTFGKVEFLDLYGPGTGFASE